MGLKFDFGGYATRNDLLCSDGRTIRRDAFKDNDGKTVPLVWNHDHSNPDNVLGHALLENRDDGVYAYCSFNDTEKGQIAKNLVRHKDVVALSIFANKLKQQGGNVLHGAIREVSLVLAGANPGATIDSYVLEHGDYSEDSGIICMVPDEGETNIEYDGEIYHSDEYEDEGDEEMDEELTVQEIYDDMTDEQKAAVEIIVGQALIDAEEEAGEEYDEDEEYEDPDEEYEDEEYEDEGDDEDMRHSVFDTSRYEEEEYLTHSDMDEILADATRGTGTSLKETMLAHGIDSIDVLFPDAKNVTTTPEFIRRETTWVGKLMNGTHHTPFSRIKSLFANITADEARARGYMKGNRKEEEVFTLLKRTTDPQTVYKKQAFERDDVIDITDFDVVSWTKTEMRGMLDEEIARAVIVGDGRSSASNDKIHEEHIRPVWTDDDLYTIKKVIRLSAGATDSARATAFIEGIIRARKDYKGSGDPTLFTTEDMLTDCLLIKDGIGHYMYDDVTKLAKKLRVKEIVTVPVMENLTRVVGADTHYLLGIVMNPADYNIGADKGGSVNLFDDFDIDFNQQKYLIETRCSGALIKPFSAIAVEYKYASFILGAEAVAGTETMLGKSVADLQDGIVVTDSGITGTLKYVTGYTGYSGDPALQKGNFIALQFAAPEGATTTIQVLNGASANNPVTLDSDMNMNAVIRIANKHNQKIKVVSTTTDGEVLTKVLDLSFLKLETA